MNKNKSYICPYCGEEVEIDIIDVELCDNNTLFLTITCSSCPAAWVERFILNYHGYGIRQPNGKQIFFNAEGIEIDNIKENNNG